MAAQMAAMGHTTPGTSGDGMGMAGMSHSGSAMVIAHLVAAAVTYWALRNAERVEEAQRRFDAAHAAEPRAVAAGARVEESALDLLRTGSRNYDAV